MTVLIPEKKPKKLILDDGKTRLDGRALDEMRPFKCEIGVLPNTDGSAYVEHGGNKIYAGVYGPREVHPKHLGLPDRGILRVYYRMATFSVHERTSPAPNRRALEISKIIEDAITPTLFLELYPDSAIEVYVTVIAAAGGTRCASTTAVSLALADAGIPMKTLVAGIAAGKADGKIILDCNDEEDKAGDADVPCAIQMKDEKINLLQFDGDMTPEELDLALNYIKKGAKIIFQKMVEAIHQKFEKIQKKTEIETQQMLQQQAAETSKVQQQQEAKIKEQQSIEETMVQNESITEEPSANEQEKLDNSQQITPNVQIESSTEKMQDLANVPDQKEEPKEKEATVDEKQTVEKEIFNPENQSEAKLDIETQIEGTIEETKNNQNKTNNEKQEENTEKEISENQNNGGK